MLAEAPSGIDIGTVQAELERLQKALLEVLPVFPAFFDAKECRWPYTHFTHRHDSVAFDTAIQQRPLFLLGSP
jgi:hypothetical protein